ncbi:MAG: SufD family Fe-S cluster assembly protein [Candidatus Micrarchaeaceae archaeon]
MPYKSYNEFVKEATQYYSSLPVETNELYKKYSLSIALPEKQAHGSPEGLEKMVAQISEKTRLKFDAVITDSFAKSMNPGISIAKSESVPLEQFENKLFKSSDDKFAAYVNATAQYFVTINAARRSKSSLNILLVSAGHLSAQILVNAGESAKSDVSEFYFSTATGSVSVLHEVKCESNSKLEINCFHNEGSKASVLALFKGNTAEQAKLSINSIYCGAVTTKARSVLDAKGTASSIEVTELAFGVASQQFDIDTAIINSTPNSSVFLDSGVILDDTSKCMLKGFAKVADKTKGSSSQIAERGILMSKDAHMDALPDLSIDYSNEVKASHSASTTPIDQEALFYLTSRGIDEAQAIKLFISAFISKYISKLSAPAAREVAMSVMLDKLDKKEFGTITEITPRNIWAVSKPSG